MENELKTDFALSFNEKGTVDLAIGSKGMQRVNGKQNLIQALKLLLLCDKGELTELGHTRYGTSIRDFLGEPLVRSNLELMRRIVQKAILRDSRVEEVIKVTVSPCPGEPGAVYIEAIVKAIDGSDVEVAVTISENI